MNLVSMLLIVSACAALAEKPSPIGYRSAAAVSSSAAVPEEMTPERKPTSVASSTQQAQAGRETGIACYSKETEQLTAAHPAYAFGSRVRVTSLANHRSVIVTITDRAMLGGGRVISVSRKAAEELGFVSAGTTRVTLEPVI